MGPMEMWHRGDPVARAPSWSSSSSTALSKGPFFISPYYLLLRYIGSSLCGELSLRSPRLCQIPDSGARLPDAEPRVLFQQH